MTEDEAKTKWCPMIRWTSAQNGLDSFENRGSNCMCIATDCMMWRAEKTAYSVEDAKSGNWILNGYCGLAGKP